MENLSGQTIKGYELRERIGAGGFGAVYRANQSTVGREVAIKIILPHFSNHPDFVRRFEMEAQMVARLEHLHIIPLYDYWRDSDGAYLVMRWLKGGSLREALQNGAYNPESAAMLLDQISAALSAAHRSNIIHRDLKPGNILLDEDGNAYLADFGIAKDVGRTSSVTEPDAIIGSPDYLAPEQARSELVTTRTDIYSLGVVLYEMLTGEHPFPNLNMVERLFKHLNEPLPEITSLPDDLHDAVNKVIQKATAKNPANRFSDTQEMAAAFRAAIKSVMDNSMVEVLTRREQDILLRIVDGRSNKEIAQELFITITTVKWYIRQIYQKLGVRSRVQAIVRARELNLIVVSGTTASASHPDSSISVIPTDQFQPENPYKGLRAFQSADNQDFFGREKLVEKLLKRMSGNGNGRAAHSPSGEGTRFLAVVGPSGSGKSSLVKAGLIPAIWRGDLSGSEKWFVVEMLPGAHPLDELEVALTRVAANQTGSLNEHLGRDKRGLVRAAGLILPNDGSELLLVIDQFEEVFTLVEDEQERTHFLNLLQTAVTDSRSRVHVVITLRADFYDRPLHYPDFGELVRSRMETVLPLSADGLERAIAHPAERVGVRFEPGLVASIIGEINYQPGALPLLQYALTELFEHRQGHLLTQEAYQAIGRTTGALAKRADEIYLGLDEAGQEVTRQMFLRLVTLGEGAEDTRRRTARSELLAIGNDKIDPDTIDDLMDTFAAYRLLSLDNDPGTRTPTVEVAHEAILREWERLREWLNESREDIRLQRQLSTLAHDWEMAKQDSSFLLRGARLEAFEKWMVETKLALTTGEQTFLQSSLTNREQEQAVDEERQLRVKALEQRSVTFLRALVAVLLLATLGAFGLSGVAVNQTNLTQQALATSDANFQRSEAQRLAAEGKGLLLQSGSGEVAGLLAVRSLNIQYTPQGDELLVAASLLDYPVREFIGHTDRVKAVDYSPDGRYVLTGSGDSTVRLWDAKTGQELRRFSGDMQDINTAVFSPDARYVLTGSRHDHTVRLWDVETGQELRRFSEGNSGAFSLNGQRIFVYSEETTGSTMIDLQTGDVLHTIPAPQTPRRPEQSGYSPDGTLYVDIPPEEGGVHIKAVDSGKEILSFALPISYNNFAFSVDNRYFLITNGDNNTLMLWNLETGQLLHTLVGHSEQILSAVFSADSRLIATGSDDRSVRVWDVLSGREIRRFNGHTQAVRKVAFSPDGLFVLSGGFDQRALLWEVTPTAGLPRFIEQNDGIRYATYSLDGSYIAAGKRDGQTMLWDAVTGELMKTFQANNELVWFTGFAPNGKWLATMSDMLRIWDIKSGEMLSEYSRINAVNTGALDISSDGQYLLTGEIQTRDVILWDISTGNEMRRFAASTSVDTVKLAPDQKHFLAYSFDEYTLRVFDTDTGLESHTFEVVSRAPMGFTAFSPDSHTIFAGSSDGRGWLWDVETGQQLHELVGHRDTVSEGTFNRDGFYLATSGDDNTVRIWKTDTGQEVRRITLPFVPYGADFSIDDRYLLVLGSDEKIHLFYAGVEDSVNDLCSRLLRDFTPEEREQYEITDSTSTCPQFGSASPP